MADVVVFARLTAKAGAGDRLVDALRPLAAQVLDEPGTLQYEVHRAGDEVWVFERYVDHAAFEAHASSDVAKMVVAGLSDLLGAAPDIALTTEAAEPKRPG